MRLFSFRHGKFRRLGVDATVGGIPRVLDLTQAWRRFVVEHRYNLPSFPDLDELVANPGFDSALLKECMDYLAHLPGRDIEAWTLSGAIQFEVPIKRPSKILCMVKNYREHAKEFGGPAPSEPLFFAKLPSALVAHGEPIVLPKAFPGRVDHEAELGVIIGKTGRNIPVETARQHVFGYTIINDVTQRDLQKKDKEAGMPWTRGKSLDTFCPCGPYIVLREDFDDRNKIVRAWVNGTLRQEQPTSAMIFDVATIIASLSRYHTLVPGDLIATGTPAGVGPLEAGDVVTIEIEGLGKLENPVRAE